MYANSRPVSSSQSGLHPRLHDIVRRHLTNPARKPVADFNRRAFDTLLAHSKDRPLIFDAFCGTGHSSASISRQYPQHLVVGIDQSAHRLARCPDLPDNCLLLQAECESLWQLACEAKLTIDRQYFLYPNPWPKPGHIQRRIHGCAAFPWMLQLGGSIELRSNWELYVREFAEAMAVAGRTGITQSLSIVKGLTRFEEKYRQSGHTLWRYTSLP
ncbi:MAG: SAM-dependent methyltransferase [Gammaproteobacteria bacterium]|nr:MAG: SAM-dependent methyltransferase [Gammaproteobacteria bacterium]